MSNTPENMNTGTPHGNAIGLTIDECATRTCVMRVPYAEHLVGDPDTGTVHGGVITVLLDNASGCAVRCHEEALDGQGIATLDLRIDYMRPAKPHEDIIAEAHCYKMAKSVAFVRATAHQGDKDDPVATSVATFMLGTRVEPRT